MRAQARCCLHLHHLAPPPQGQPADLQSQHLVTATAPAVENTHTSDYSTRSTSCAAAEGSSPCAAPVLRTTRTQGASPAHAPPPRKPSNQTGQQSLRACTAGSTSSADIRMLLRAKAHKESHTRGKVDTNDMGTQRLRYSHNPSSHTSQAACLCSRPRVAPRVQDIPHRGSSRGRRHQHTHTKRTHHTHCRGARPQHHTGRKTRKRAQLQPSQRS